MAERPIEPEVIDFTLRSLRTDEPPARDMLKGEFYDKDDWLSNLPKNTQALICAVQKAGDHPDRPLHCTNIAAQHFHRWQSTKNIEDLNSAIALYVVALRYTIPDDLQRLDRLDAIAFAYQAKWEHTKSDRDLDIAAHFFNRGVVVAGPDDPILAKYLTNLAFILNRRWSLLKRPQDREDAKHHFAKATELSISHPMYPQMLSNYGEFIRLTSEGEETLRISALKEAVELLERAVQLLRPGLAVPYGTIWRNAAIANHDLYEITMDEKFSAKTVEFYRQSIASTTQHSHSILARNELAEHYVLRYKMLRHNDDFTQGLQLYDAVLEIKDTHFAATIGKADMLWMKADANVHSTESRAEIHEACRLADNSINLIDASSQSRGWAYFRTSAIYSTCYERDGEGRFLDRAVELSKLSLQYSKHRAFWEFSCWCAETCLSRYDKTGSPEDLSMAFKAVHGAMNVLDKRETKALASCYWYLGKCYMSEHSSHGRPEDLEAALEWLEAACVPSSKQEQTLALRQNDLANAFRYKFHQSFNIRHLDRAIDTYAYSLSNLRKARLPSNHDNFAILRTGIGSAMIERYNRWSSQDDLKSAIESFRGCLRLTETHSPRYAGRVCNLSWSLQLMFMLQKDLSLLEEAQSYLLTVLNSNTDPGSQLLRLAHFYMGNIYLSYFDSSKNVADLDLAVEQYDHMETLSGDDSRFRADAANNKAIALHKKALVSGHLQSYLDSIAEFDDAAKMNSTRPTQLITARLNRAETFRDMYEQLHDAHYGHAALREFSELAARNDARTDLLLRAAEVASRLEVSLNKDYGAAYLHAKEALDILPGAVLLFSNRLEQLRLVRKYHFLPSNGMALAIAADVQPSQILANIEQSRAFIWERYLLSETPIKALREQHEQFANEFERLRSLLITQRPSESNSIIGSALPPKDQLRLERHAHTQSYDELLAKIRQEKGFEHFPLTYAPDDINVGRDEAMPIVYINLNTYRCDAVIAFSNGVKVLALKDLEMDHVFYQAGQLYAAQLQLSEDFRMACATFEQVMLWLWQAVAKPILEHLERDGFNNGDMRNKRVFWVSSGWLSVFPIHAAGDWTLGRRPETNPSVQERCISSYIPSIKALDFLRRQSEHHGSLADEGKALLVGMPDTPGMSQDSDLNADIEIASIMSLMDEDISAQVLLSPLPTSSDVKSALSRCEMAHFACHGCADREDPSKSALRFADWKKNPFNVRTMLNMKLERCQLVVLSACETAANKDILLRDEGLHIAGAFNMAGVPHAVAGMWKISDEASIELVQAFYTALFQDQSRQRYTATATALHTGTESLRAKGLHPLLWGAFVHMGP